MKNFLLILLLLCSSFISTATNNYTSLLDSSEFHMVCPSDTFVECPYPRTFSVQSIEEFNNLGGEVYSSPYEITTFSVDETIDYGYNGGYVVNTYTAKNSINETLTCQQVIHLSDWSYPEILCPPNDTVNNVDDAPLPFEELYEFIIGGGNTSIACLDNYDFQLQDEFLDTTTFPFVLNRYYEYYNCVNSFCLSEVCTHRIVEVLHLTGR